MIILGLCTMGSSAACLFVDGVCVAAVEEERLSRIKNDGAFPLKAIAECLRLGNTTIDKVDKITVYWEPYRVGTRAWGVIKKSLGSLSSAKSMFSKITNLFSTNITNEERPEQTGSWAELFKVKKIINKKIGPFKGDVLFYDHHLTHQLYAESIRLWENAIILSYDGGGEGDSTVLSVRHNGKLKVLKKVQWPNSLGHFYSYFTGYLGFKMLEAEYVLMGLSSLGEPVYKDAILNTILRLEKDGGYTFNTRLCDYHGALEGKFNEKLSSILVPPRAVSKLDTPSEEHVNLAASVQAAFEECQQHMLKWAKEQYPDIDKLVISGGCGLNVTANGKVLEKGLFSEIIVPPAPHDAGCAIGSVLAYMHEKDPTIGQFANTNASSGYLGATFTDEDIEEAFKEMNLPLPEKLETKTMVNTVAQALSERNVIAWFQYAREMGPRALVSTSFLADPRNEEIREVMNQKIKKRELFRPFAPSTIAEACSDFFELDQESPYMNIVAQVKEDKKKVIPAVTHVNGSARVHTITKESNPLAHDLIKAFGDITGVPVLLNTSFNIQEPIVYTPKNAITTFMKSGVDILAIGNYICDQSWRDKVSKN